MVPLLLAFVLPIHANGLSGVQPAYAGEPLRPDLVAGQAPGAFDCIIKPHREVSLSSPVSGVIAEIDADRGSIVRRGDVVAKLVSDVEQANLALATRKASSGERIAAARARIDFLTRRLERNERLNQRNIVADGLVDEIATELKIAQEDLNTALVDKELAALEMQQAEAVLAQKIVRSPIDGIVTRLLREAGEFTSEQTPIAAIAAIDPLHVETYLPNRLHGAITGGMAARIFTEAPANGSFDATVTVVDRVYDAASGTFGVRLVMPNRNMEIPAGTRCELKFLIN